MGLIQLLDHWRLQNMMQYIVGLSGIKCFFFSSTVEIAASSVLHMIEAYLLHMNKLKHWVTALVYLLTDLFFGNNTESKCCVDYNTNSTKQNCLSQLHSNINKLRGSTQMVSPRLVSFTCFHCWIMWFCLVLMLIFCHEEMNNIYL